MKLQEPIDKFLPATDKQPFNQKQAALFTKQLVDRLEDTTLRVKQELDKSRSRFKSQYDKNVHTSKIPVGSSVMLWDPGKKLGLSKCFQPKWSGPWTIIYYTSETNCKLSNNRTKKSMKVCSYKPA